MTLIKSDTNISNVVFNNLKSQKGPAIFAKNSKVNIGEVNFAKTKQGHEFGFTKDYKDNKLNAQLEEAGENGMTKEQKQSLYPLLSLIWVECDDEVEKAGGC